MHQLLYIYRRSAVVYQKFIFIYFNKSKESIIQSGCRSYICVFKVYVELHARIASKLKNTIRIWDTITDCRRIATYSLWYSATTAAACRRPIVFSGSHALLYSNWYNAAIYTYNIHLTILCSYVTTTHCVLCLSAFNLLMRKILKTSVH